MAGNIITKLCVVCKKPATETHAPFCSLRCQDADLGAWLGGGYVIAGDEPIRDEHEDDD